MAIRKVHGSWWIDFRFHDVRYRERSPENSKPGAQAYEALLRQRLAKGEPLAGLEQKSKEQGQQFKGFAWKWFDLDVRTTNKPSEISHKTYTLRSNLIPFFGQMPINQITTLKIDQYKAEKLKEGLNPKTINNHLTVLGKCLRMAQEWLELEKIPKIKKLKLPPSKFDFLSHKESELLLAHANGVWYEIILAALKTGLRIGELKALTWSDINWDNRTLAVRYSWCECKKGLTSPKSNRERHIPIVDELYDLLLKRRQPRGPVFLDERGQRFNGKRLNHEISKACKKAGIFRKISCHTLRHTFASDLVAAGASLKAVQELLGHANIQTTMRYAHLGSSSLKETMDLLERKRIINFGQQAVNSEESSLGPRRTRNFLITGKPLF